MTAQELDDLMHSNEYGDFIMDNAKGERVICNGDMLLDAMEDGYMLEEFLASKGFAND